MKEIALFGAGLLGKSVINTLLKEGYSIDVFDMSNEKLKGIESLHTEKLNLYNFD